MEQYPIPQFIEAEGKVAFFLTFRQFFYLMAAGIVCFILYFILPTTIFYIASFLVVAIAAVLGFGMVNGVPILSVLLGSIGFFAHGKDYTWQKKDSLYPFKPIQRTQIRKIEEAPVLQAQTSQLKKAKAMVELKTKQ